MSQENLLLQALPADVLERVKPHLQSIELTRGQILHHPGDTIQALYFPLNSLISITVTMAGGKTAETGVIGNREVAGINAFMGGRETTQTEYVTQIPGKAIMIAAARMREEFDRNTEMRNVMLKYTQAYVAQISQNAACNRLHVTHQRFARWLLEARDRIESDDLELTQEFLGEMLGVRRASINQISCDFEAQNIISTRRGLTSIVDNEKLEAASCECYAVLKEEYDRLLGIK